MASKLVRRWIVLTLAASIVSALDGGFLATWAALAPARIWHGEVWRLVTWPFIELGPIQLVVTCIVIYHFGGELAVRWGDARLFRFARHVVLAAAVATCVVTAIAGGQHMHRLGGWAITDALVIAWARQYPQREVTVYGLLRLNGRDLIRFTIAVTAVIAIYVGPIHMLPELVACAAAALYPRGLLRA